MIPALVSLARDISPRRGRAKPKMETPLTINQIQLTQVDFILASQGELRRWGKKEHCAFLARLAIASGMPRENAKAFLAILGENGAGGNASQFRQWLETPAPKGPGKLAKATSLEAEYGLD